jgi:DNA-binding NtrC family response regulator
MVDYPDLKGARVLVIEDEALLTKIAADTLAELGCTLAGTAGTVESGVAAIKNSASFDCVMLDVRLGEQLSSEIAMELIKENVPFIICSGYSIRLAGLGIPIVDKPYTAERLGGALAKALGKSNRPIHAVQAAN